MTRSDKRKEKNYNFTGKLIKTYVDKKRIKKKKEKKKRTIVDLSVIIDSSAKYMDVNPWSKWRYPSRGELSSSSPQSIHGSIIVRSMHVMILKKIRLTVEISNTRGPAAKGNLKCLLINKVSILRQQWITSIVLDKHRQSCSMLVSMAASNFHFRTCNCNFPNFRLNKPLPRTRFLVDTHLSFLNFWNTSVSHFFSREYLYLVYNLYKIKENRYFIAEYFPADTKYFIATVKMNILCANYIIVNSFCINKIEDTYEWKNFLQIQVKT